MMMRQGSRSGFAITIVVLVTLIALGAFVFSAAVLGLASRTATSVERNSIQALLTADAALSTLPARATLAPTSPTNNFTAWIGDEDSSPSGLWTYDMDAGATAVLTVLQPEAADIVVVQADASFGPASRRVVQAFRKVVPDPVPLRVSVPGALTSTRSFPPTGGGTAEVVGLGSAEDDWIFTSRWTLASNNKPLQVPRNVCEAADREYVQIGEWRYRVGLPDDPDGGEVEYDMGEFCPAGPVTVTPIGLSPAVSPVDVTDSVGLIPFATTGAFSAENFHSVVPVTDATTTLFSVGSPILIGDNVGEVTAVGDGELTVRWTTWVDAITDEGTIVRKDVPAGVTAGACPTGTQVFEGDCVSDQVGPLYQLFEKIFLNDPETVQASATTLQASSGGQITTPDESIGWFTPTSNATLMISGTGVVVIDARSRTGGVTINVQNDFEGFIYVLGDLNLQGNAVSRGAVVADGQIEIVDDEYVLDDGTTNVAGTMSMFYDPIALQRAIAGLTVPSGDPPSLGAAVPGSWRIR